MTNGQKQQQQQQQKIRDKIKSDFPHQKQQIHTKSVHILRRPNETKQINVSFSARSLAPTFCLHHT
ncbi:hypothetical protein BLOT_012798 [Blomia tropicalis]|nr:hypothetical protein BLOT_012798 [Blomia tropicalis]